MAGCLLYFCAEWRRGRRVIQLDTLDAAALQGLIEVIEGEGELPGHSAIARQYEIEGWRVEASEAADLSLALKTMGNAVEIPSRRPSTSGTCEPPEPTTQAASANSTSRSGGFFGGAMKKLVAITALQGIRSPRAPQKSRTTLLGNEKTVQPAIPTSLLFFNPAHTLSSLREEMTKDEFVQEVRKRLCTERLFPSATSGSGSAPEVSNQAVLSIDETEDLYEMLFLMQQPRGGTHGALQMGRALDAVVDMFFALNHFRAAMDRGASSLSAFFNSLDLDKNNMIESAELRHFFKNADGGALGGIAGAGVQKMAEVVFSVLDTNRDQKIELWELQRQLSLVVPPRLSLVEFIGHMEMKYGVGKCGFNKEMDRVQFFDHWCQREMLDVSPEDVLRCFRSMAGKSQVVMPSSFEAFSKRLPLETAWGVEPFVTDKFFSAIGARALMLERSKKQDASLPYEAVFEAEGDAGADQSEMKARFERLWERCTGLAGTSGVEKQLRDGCFQRYLEASHHIKEDKRTAEDRRAVARSLGPRSLFPNIGDVLATGTTRLCAGQVCIVRYRLQGGSNFIHPEKQVLKDEREVIPWPCPKKALGDTPFVGLVPRGLHWTSAGGGGFYLGQKAFTRVDPNLRADLPKDPAAGSPMLYGYVEIVAPSLTRTAREKGSKGKGGMAADFELRLFCSSKGKITGCIGEPVHVQVVHQTQPPPMESLQVRCEGRAATLRWSTIDLGREAAQTGAEAVALYMRSEKAERTLRLDPELTEWELKDLAADTEYEVRIRMENRTGFGREAVTSFRTNALCQAPHALACAVNGTTHVELRWPRLRSIGNEETRDRFQTRKEAIERYEGTLRVEDDEKVDADAADKLGARTCEWTSGNWREDKDGNLTARLGGLRPDTRYVLEGFCAVNSMGRGAVVRNLAFWTVPQTPRVATVRVRHGFVLIALSQAGGVSIKEYSVHVFKTNQTEEKASNFTIPYSNLAMPTDHGLHPELSLPFLEMPGTVNDETHTVRLRANNPGGWSEWSKDFETTAIARQQGADQAQVALIQAMEARRIEVLAKLLEDVRGIEFSDERYVKEATELLGKLKAARAELAEAMQARDPGPLRQALKVASEVGLPDLGKAEALLKKLEATVVKMQSAKGIDALRLALRAAYESRLPQPLLAGAVEKLGTREAAQQGLEQAMEAARVPGLEGALKNAEGMHLPSEKEAEDLLARLRHSEGLLVAALSAELISDLEYALKAVSDSGLKEYELILDAEVLLADLRSKQDAAKELLLDAMAARHPDHLRTALVEARLAQVPEDTCEEAHDLLEHLDSLVADVKGAEGVAARCKTLETSRSERVPEELLAAAEVQLIRLRELHVAVDFGHMEQLRLALKVSEICGVKAVEMEGARATYRDWLARYCECESAIASQEADRLRRGIADAGRAGINEDELKEVVAALALQERRDAAENDLRRAMAAREFEALDKAYRRACDEEVASCPLLAEARGLMERLQLLRYELSAARDTNELRTLYTAVVHSTTDPQLPSAELEMAEKQLQELRDREEMQITAAVGRANDRSDFHMAAALDKHAKRVADTGVVVDEEILGEALTLASTSEQEHRRQMEKDLQQQRTLKQFPKWTGRVPESVEQWPLPYAAITGEFRIHFRPSGTEIAVLPREIVEGNILVILQPERDGPAVGLLPNIAQVGRDPIFVGALGCTQLMRLLRQSLPKEDNAIQWTDPPRLIGDDGLDYHIENLDLGHDGKLEVGWAVYVRAKRSGLDLAHSLCEPLPGGADPRVGEESFTLEAEKAVAQRLGRALDTRLSGRPVRPRRLLDHTRNVRSRMLRRLTLELSWTYPRGIMDALDAACFAFDEETLVEIIDRRGNQGSKYGASNGKRWMPPGADGLHGAVKHAGDIVDTDKRTGKQVLTIRIDFLPRNITDLFFVLTTSSSRDLSRFGELRVKIHDADTMAVLAETKATNCGKAEAAIMCSLYHLEDGLWRVNSVCDLCKGNTRDYRQVLNRLNELGYPRNVGMREQVPPLYRVFHDRLQLEDVECKTTDITMGPVSYMHVRYAIELFDENADGHNKVRQIGKSRFVMALAEALISNTMDRLTEEDFEIDPAVFKTLHHVALELSWKCPTSIALPVPRAESAQARAAKDTRSERKSRDSRISKAKHIVVQEAPPDQAGDGRLEGKLEFANLLDGVCMLFEEQGLREVVDYRGPHGVRLVSNGVLDYRGVWAGKVGIGDATGGAVSFINEVIDNAEHAGKNNLEVRFDKLPRSTSDLFFSLSTPTAFDISEFSELRVVLRDAENPGHEIASAHIGSVHKGEAVVLAAISRSNDSWTLNAYGCTSMGSARDYRQALLCLRAIQEKKHTKLPPWPHQVRDPGGPRPPREKLSLTHRLPDLNLNGIEHRRVSAISSIASFIATLPEDLPMNSPRTPGSRTPSVCSHISRGIGNLQVIDERNDRHQERLDTSPRTSLTSR